MTRQYLLDASALLAIILNESGSDRESCYRIDLQPLW